MVTGFRGGRILPQGLVAVVNLTAVLQRNLLDIYPSNWRAENRVSHHFKNYQTSEQWWVGFLELTLSFLNVWASDREYSAVVHLASVSGHELLCLDLPGAEIVDVPPSPSRC